MATTGETVPDSGPADAAAADAAERLANAAGEAADIAGEALKLEGEGYGTQGDAWSFWFTALMTVAVVVVCYVAKKIIRGESPKERRLRLRAERRAKKKAENKGPDEIDRLLASIVRRLPGQVPPPGAIPISGGRPGMVRGAPPGAGAGQGSGAAAAAAAARMAAVGRENGAARGPPPGADHRPKLRWDQSNEEVELMIRVDSKVARGDVKVDITSTMLKLILRGQLVLSGHHFKPVDPEGCTWVIDDPGPGLPKELTITLLKAEPATSKQQWWRAPLKGLETRGPPAPNRRPAPSQPADPEMVRKAIEAIKAKQGAGAKPGVKLGAKSPAIQGTPPPAASSSNPAGASVPGNATAGAGEAAGASASNAAPAAQTVTKSGKTGGKKKNRKKK